MSERKYESGHVVKVMGQKVEMTVESIGGNGFGKDRVNCVWFDARNQLQRSSFSSSILEFVR